jgi:hypothetical protein
MSDRALLVSGLALAAALVVPGVARTQDERPRLAAGTLPPDLKLDGVLDEPAWSAAPAIEGLVMTEPQEGGTPAGRSQVRVLAGPKALVFGFRCEDPEPSGIVSFTKERDGDLEFEDHVVIVLDPFQDGRSGYVFAVNPGGARFDALVSGGGEDTNKDWDGIWEAATHRDDSGWSAEIRVPIETLSFARRLREWSFNVQRRVQRLQETSRWASPKRDWEVTQTSRAGLLTGLPEFDLGLGLSIRPSAVGGFRRPTEEASTDGTGDPSLDATKRLGSNLLASLTVNTDFAETEVDERRINLTRFPLFFPEKRTFFLESADIFEFGTGLGEDVIPYFSRRVGLVEGQEVPILAGLKLSGRMGRTGVGGLVVRTREKDGLAPDANLGVLRLKQSVLAESWVGFIGTAGDPLGRPGSWTAGVDLAYQTSRFLGGKNFLVLVHGLATDRDGRRGDKTAFGLKIDYPNDLWDCFLMYKRIGDAFDPSLGFVPRPGVQIFQAKAQYAPRPESSWVRQRFYLLAPAIVSDLSGRRESYRVLATPVDWRLESGERFELGFEPTGERLREPFTITDAITVPEGDYHWRRYRLAAETAAKRRLAAEAEWTFGGFYSGRLHQLALDLAWTPSPLVTFLVSAEHNRAHLREGDFDQTLVGTKVRLNLSPDLQINSFLQYDTESRTFGTNTRLRWTFRPQGELFVIYNHNLRETLDRWRRDSNELLVKLQYTLRR